LRKLAVLTAAALAAIGLTASPASATTTAATIYNATPSTLPGNLPSVGAEAYSFQEFGDEIAFTGTQRTLNTVGITMSSWACQSGGWSTRDCSTAPGATFKVPVTLNIYEAQSTTNNGTPVGVGDLITRVRKTFSIPYRPSANFTHCTGANAGKWWQKSTNTCFNGKAANISFNFSSLGMTLPDTVVVGISYNTTHYGPHPIGESAACFTASGGCPYDSLNIGLSPSVGTGSEVFPGTVFQNAASQGDYCDGTPAINTFNLDSPTSQCWAGSVPAIKVTAS
jgi:hypothetical protein